MHISREQQSHSQHALLTDGILGNPTNSVEKLSFTGKQAAVP
jgi:hypothetical protein